MMRAWLFLLLLPMAALAEPRLYLDVRLDPATRQLNAAATLVDMDGLAGFSLAAGFEVTSITVDGRRLEMASVVQNGRAFFPLPEGSRRVSLVYQGGLAPLVSLDHREVLGTLPAMSGEEGSFLPAGSGWYPVPASPFSYRLQLTLPPGQKGLVAGNLLSETNDASGYQAAYDFPYPSDGIDLMAGPYALGEQTLALPSGRRIGVRTWFHPELARLSPGYLEDSAAYLERYSLLLGEYPFDTFSIVSSPLPTGFGMPSLTYLGRDVLKLPFIRTTSLGHEVLHNWWGNGVYPDWQRGNWSEGLTTFLADYAYKEDQGETAAREMRLAWLRDLAAVPADEDIALKDFVARHHGISSIVGYNKSAMVFFMLRDEIGPLAFVHGLRLLWERHRFRTASWDDLEAVFAEAAGRPLKDFFRQWLQRPGAPSLRLESAIAMGDTLQLEFSGRDGYDLHLPLQINHASHSETRWVDLSGDTARLTIDPNARIESVQLDPSYRIWRRIDPALLPAILREVFVAPKVSLVVTDGGDLRFAAHALAEHVLDAAPVLRAPGAPLGSDPLLVVGSAPTVDAWLAQRGLPPRPDLPGHQGSAQVWAGRDGSGRPLVVVSAKDADALTALQRGLPHYGRQSWLVFEGARAVDKGTWPPGVEEVRLPGGTR